MTVGPHGDPAALGPQPAHVMVERYVSQTAVLPLCAAVVSHGGSGTVFGAAGLGLPQVCLPQAADQFRNTAGVVGSGAGIGLHPDQADGAAGGRGGAQRCCTTREFRAAAGRLQPGDRGDAGSGRRW